MRKQERQRDSAPGALDCVFSCAMAYRLYAPNECHSVIIIGCSCCSCLVGNSTTRAWQLTLLTRLIHVTTTIKYIIPDIQFIFNSHLTYVILHHCSLRLTHQTDIVSTLSELDKKLSNVHIRHAGIRTEEEDSMAIITDGDFILRKERRTDGGEGTKSEERAHRVKEIAVRKAVVCSWWESEAGRQRAEPASITCYICISVFKFLQ